jgi:hypothetical protein
VKKKLLEHYTIDYHLVNDKTIFIQHRVDFTITCMEENAEFALTINTDIDQKTQLDDDNTINSGFLILLCILTLDTNEFKEQIVDH